MNKQTRNQYRRYQDKYIQANINKERVRKLKGRNRRWAKWFHTKEKWKNKIDKLLMREII